MREYSTCPDAHVVELSPDASIVPAEASNVDALFPWCTYQVTINAPVPDPSSEIETTSAPLLFLKKRKKSGVGGHGTGQQREGDGGGKCAMICSREEDGREEKESNMAERSSYTLIDV